MEEKVQAAGAQAAGAGNGASAAAGMPGNAPSAREGRARSGVREDDAAAAPAASRAFGEVGLGVDIVEIERMRAILGRSPRFVERVFTAAERAYCDSKAMPEIHYATRFAAKEAVLKALGTGFSGGIQPHDVEVERTAKGRPVVALHRRAKEVARELGVSEIPLSLSYTHTEAVACAMAITADATRASRERTDPTEELARQFKEARKLLDEMPPAGAAQAGAGAAAAEGVGASAGVAGADAAVGAAAGAEVADASLQNGEGGGLR